MVGEKIRVFARATINGLAGRVVARRLHVAHTWWSSMPDNVFFLPGIGAQSQNRRDQSKRCNETAPSNPKESASRPIHPDYPFQLTVAGIFHMAGRKYIIYVDRYSDWTEVNSIHQDAKASTVYYILRRYFKGSFLWRRPPISMTLRYLLCRHRILSTQYIWRNKTNHQPMNHRRYLSHHNRQ